MDSNTIFLLTPYYKDMEKEQQLTAKEAAEIADKRRVTVILALIDDAANMGQNHINVKHQLSNLQVDELRGLGYDVEFFQHLGGHAISW